MKPTTAPPRLLGVVLLLAMNAAACAETTGATGADGSSTEDAGADWDALTDADEGGGTCAATTCGRGRDCCLVTGRCFDPRRPGDCAFPPADAGVTISTGDPGARPCTSNSGCAPTEFCHVQTRYYQGCLGVGVCEPRNNAGTCSPANSRECQVCGCDGVTYASMAAAWRAGVNSHSGRCGVAPVAFDAGPDGATVVGHAPCGAGSECPSGEVCCGITGQCYDAMQCPACCRMPPPGTVAPCGSNADCPRHAPVCAGGPACDAPGFCVPPRGNCTGALDPACGCDGVTYVNACQADLALARVAHAGACRDE